MDVGLTPTGESNQSATGTILRAVTVTCYVRYDYGDESCEQIRYRVLKDTGQKARLCPTGHH